MSNENINIHDLKKLVGELKSALYNKNYIKNCKKVRQLATVLSSLLPKVSDATIFEIDDVIYGEDDSDVVAGTNLTSEENIAYLAENCYECILEIYFNEKIYYDRIVDMVLLQLLELISEKTLFETKSRSFSCIGGYCDALREAMVSLGYDSCIERHLKVLKVIGNSKTIKNFEDLEGIYSIATVGVLSLLIIGKNSELENTTEKRRAIWLKEQSTSVFEKFVLDVIQNDSTIYLPKLDFIRNCVLSDKEGYYNMAYVSNLAVIMLLKGFQNVRFCFDYWYAYFTSARDEDEKKQRFEDFLRGLSDYEFFLGNQPDDEDRTGHVRMFALYISSDINELFQDIIKYPSAYLMKLQRYHEHDIGPYLSENSKCSAYLTFKEETVKLVDKYFGGLNYSDGDNDISQETFFEGERVSLYHKFMKGLQLFDILHTALMMLNGEDENDSWVATIFRSDKSPIRTVIMDLIKKPSESRKVDWWIPIALKNCPFLFLSHHNEAHMKILVKLLKGINIGKSAEEMLYFLFNDTEFT